MPDYVDTMAYAGQVPWHGLGTKLDADAPTDVMIRAAGMDWDIIRHPVTFTNPVTGKVETVPNRSLLLRDDTGACIGPNPVADSFTAISNRDLFEFGDVLHREGGALWNTAGVLHDGRRVWALAQVPGQFEVRGEALAPFLLLYDARDKSSTFRVRFTTVRVVCANTAALALEGNAPAEVAIRHTGDVRGKMDEARKVLGLAHDSFVEQVEVANQLAKMRFGKDDMRTLACQVLTELDDAEEAMEAIVERSRKSERSRKGLERKGSELLHLFEHGKGNRGDSAWDAFNAVTEYVDHQRGRMENYRARTSKLNAAGLASAWFGAGDSAKRRALRVLTK